MRIRTIKPEYWSHPVMSRLDADVQLVALALLSYADDHGYFRADPALIRGALFPYREDLASLSRAVAKLSEVGWIAVWSHPEQGAMGCVVNWKAHQKIDHPTPSKLARYDIRDSLASDSRGPREGLALDQGSGNREQGGDQGGAGGADALLSPAGHIPTPTTDLPGHTRKLTGRDLRLLPAASRLRVARDEQADLDHLVLLYGWDCAQTGIVALAERQPKGPIWLSAYREYLAERFILDSADYRRAGLPVPAEVLDREAREAARGA